MKFRINTLAILSCALGVLTTIRSSAQDDHLHAAYIGTRGITEFDVPHAGSGEGQGTYPQDNNTGGSITGYYVTGANVYHGFLRIPDGTVTSFDSPGAGSIRGSGQGTAPQSINSKGEIAGQYQDENYLYHGFLRTVDGTFTTIDAPAAGTEANLGTFGEDINDKGLIAGFYVDTQSVYHGFVRAVDGSIVTFDAPGAGSGAGQGTFVTFEEGLNRKGEIIGWYIDGNGMSHGYLRSPDGGTFTTIDGPGALATLLGGINPAGVITGYFADSAGVYHGLLYDDGTLTQLDNPNAGVNPGEGTASFTINPDGGITGIYIDGNDVVHGFRRTFAGAFTTIDASGAVETRPETINSAGVITGYFVDKKSVSHGFLWTP